MINLITPSTWSSRCDFLIQARDFVLDADAALQSLFNASMRALVAQGISILEAQQADVGGGRSCGRPTSTRRPPMHD